MFIRYSTWALPLYLLIGQVEAQIVTTTLPYADGDTLVISTGTNALGAPTSAILSTITAPVGGAGAVPPVNTNTATRTTATRPGAGGGGGAVGAEDPDAAGAGAGAGAAAGAGAGAQTTHLGVQGDTLPPPQKTFSYNLDGVDYTWTAVTTQLPTIATAIVPQGKQQNYEAYQSLVNGRVFEDAKDKEEAKMGQGVSGGAGLPNAAGRATVANAGGNRDVGGWVWAVLWGSVVGGIGFSWM